MSCLGVLFSLSEKEIAKLKSFKDDEDRLDYLETEIEETYLGKFRDKAAELDKSWDALHRALTDGKLEWDNGSYPLNHVILGGELLYSEDDYIMSLKTPKDVKLISEAIQPIDKEKFREMYFKINEDDYGFSVNEEDFEYTWSWFESTKEFWKNAALEKRYVLFTVDQ